MREGAIPYCMSMAATDSCWLLCSHACDFRISTQALLSSSLALLLLMLSKMLATLHCFSALLDWKDSNCALACFACPCEQCLRCKDRPGG